MPENRFPDIILFAVRRLFGGLSGLPGAFLRRFVLFLLVRAGNRDDLDVRAGTHDDNALRGPAGDAEYLSIPQDNVVRIHKSIPMEIASIFDPLGNAVHTALSWDLVGEDVLITGAGVIGCMAAAVCKKAGAKTVVITDINDFRLGLAKTLGADRTVNVTREKLEDVMKELEMTEGFDVCLEMSGAPSCLKDIIDNSRNGANISLLGIQPDGSSIEWNKFIWKGLKMKGIYGREIFETWHKMDSMIRSGLNVAPIITHRLPYTEFREGFEAMNSGKSGKVVLDWIV